VAIQVRSHFVNELVWSTCHVRRIAFLLLGLLLRKRRLATSLRAIEKS